MAIEPQICARIEHFLISTQNKANMELKGGCDFLQRQFVEKNHFFISMVLKVAENIIFNTHYDYYKVYMFWKIFKCIPSNMYSYNFI